MHRNIKLLSVFNLLTDLRFHFPIVVIYFEMITGSYSLAMSVFSIIYIVSAVFEVPTGIFSDLIGRKKTVICGVIATISSLVFYALGTSYTLLVIGAVFEGLARAFYSGNNDALLHDSLAETGKQNEYHHFLGKTSSLFQIALALSAVIGGFLASWSFNLVFWISIIPALGMFIVALFLVEPKIKTDKNSNIFLHLRESLKQFRQNFRLRYLTLASSIKYSIDESAFLFRTVFIATLWPLWALGFVSMFTHVAGALSFFISGKVIDKFKPLQILKLETMFNHGINIVALLFPSVLSPALMSTTSLSYGVGRVARNHLLQKEFTQEQRATLGSLGSLLSYILFAIASYGLGLLADRFGPINTLIIAHLLLFSPLWFYQKIFKKDK